MTLSGWILAVSVFIIILTIIVGIGWLIRNNTNTTPSSPNTSGSVFVWSKNTPGPNPNKNTCQLYEFPTGYIQLGGVPTAIPGAATFNSDILDNLQGNPTYPRCLDPDQIMAQQVERKCIGLGGSDINNSITRCFLNNGGTTGLGGTEILYSNTNCFKLSPCAGILSLISINFQSPSNSDIYCIQNEGTGNNVIMNKCDPSNKTQLFRVTRINPGQDPGSLQPGQGQNGLIAQILDRNTGLCLVPGNSTGTSIYDPKYVGCSGPTQTFTGTNVVMGECTGGIYPGYLWALIPSVPYCGVSGGCQGCTGCVGATCERCSQSNTCGFDQGNICIQLACQSGRCVGNESMPTPPQIVYIGDLDITKIPIGQTGYQGLTGQNAIIKWLIDNNAKSLYYGGEGNGLILKPIGTDIELPGACTTGDLGYKAQYMDLTTFNTISSLAVCLAEGTLGTQNCVNL